jgi:glucans biosynthesis protein C
MNSRYYGLDLSRATFMLLGLAFHASMIFRADREWRVNYEQQSPVFNMITSMLHGFRMEGFYLLSGFFFLLIIQKYGERKTIIDRYIKLGVPMLVIGCTLNYVMNRMSENYVFPSTTRYIIDGEWLAHLWFLGNLIIYCTTMVFIARPLSYIFKKYASIWPLIIGALLLVPALSTIASRAPKGTYLFISLDNFFVYLPYFILGIYLHTHRQLFLELLILRNALVLLIFSLILFTVTFVFKVAEISYTINLLLYKIANTALAIFLISLFHSIGNQPSKLVTALVDSSYTVYLLHMPLLVIYHHALKNLHLPMMLYFLLLLCTVFTSCYMFHLFLVRKSVILGFLLNGKLPAKKPSQTATLASE